MKRSMAWMASVVAVGTVAYLGGKLWAKPAAPAGAPAPTRVALLNLRLVIKKYDRYQDFVESIKKLEKNYIQQMEKKQKKMEALAKGVEELQGAERTTREKEIRTLQREIEDIKEQARAEVKEKSEKAMVDVYREVREASVRYARANNIDLVMHYEGAASKDEVDSHLLITRNMNAGGCVPLYWNEALDISEAVCEALNKNYKRGDI